MQEKKYFFFLLFFSCFAALKFCQEVLRVSMKLLLICLALLAVVNAIFFEAVGLPCRSWFFLPACLAAVLYSEVT
jgi:hypothetical protein